MAIRAQRLLAADHATLAIVILVAGSATCVAKLGNVEPGRVRMGLGFHVTRGTGIVTHHEEGVLMASLAVGGEEPMCGIDFSGIPERGAG